jgi:FkbM family methyltransferase
MGNPDHVYSLKHRAISWVSKNLFDDVTYTVRNGLNKGLRRRGGLGWVPVESSNTPEFQFWKALDLRGQVVYDIGAFHGLLTLYFARNARQVAAWEPNSHNRGRLEENLRLNSFSKVIVRPYGLSSRSMQAQMSFDPLAPGTASIDAGMARGGEQETVELRTLDEEQGLERPDLIKIDVEGFELEVLRGARRTLTAPDRRPRLFLEMHGVDQADKRVRVRAIVEYLWGLDYRDILHLESRTRITPGNTEIAAQGHLYVQAV